MATDIENRIAALYDFAFWISPQLNSNCGKSEPPANVKLPGLLAYADNVNWAPGSTAGTFQWTGSVWIPFWTSANDGTGSGLDADTVDTKHYSDLLLQKGFESSEQTITAAGSLTLAHGLGVEPKLFQVMLVCKTAEYGYSVGDKLAIQAGDLSLPSGHYGVSIVPDSTNLNIRYGNTSNVFHINDKTDGSTVLITPTSWKIIFRAWA